MADTVTDLLRLPEGPVDLTSLDPHGKPGFRGKKAAGKKALAALGPRLADLQERLYAESRGGQDRAARSLLLVLQGMDTAGKGGTIRHCIGLVDPQGVAIAAFKAPTEEEKRHDFLWRVERRAPGAGMIGIFDRSHYEDVLIARVHGLAPDVEIERRYDAINAFERRLVESGTTVVKCMLHLSRDEQRDRLLTRLDDETKHWKYTPADVDERHRWAEYRAAYEVALERCNTPDAPFFVVPADRKWYRNWAVTALLVEHLERLDLQWPPADFDVAAERQRVAAS